MNISFHLMDAVYKEVLLEFFFDPAMNNISALFIPWSMFGSSDFIQQPKSVRESFTWRMRESPGIKKPNGKTIFRVKHLTKVEIHVPRVTGEMVFAGDRYEQEMFTDIHNINENINTIISGPPLQLNHFLIQSQEFYRTVKMTRGAADLCLTLKTFELGIIFI
jgi:hypothetical protein